LHGIGSNSRVFEQQTAALRYELGESHTFDFVEGTIPWEASVESIIETGEATFAYCDPHQPQSCLQAINDLERYLRVKGPYDGVMAFSMGTCLALTIMIDHALKEGTQEPPFKVAVLFSNPEKPFDMESLRQGRIEPWDPRPIISIPIAHIWGSTDYLGEHAALAPEYCRKSSEASFVHKGGHTVPTSTEEVIQIANVIHRAIGGV
ncbi:uncharacterized protein BO87DRAFT_449248, partial [Aspergillus neoniger CBS 115656]